MLAASCCWDELVEGYAPAHGRPALHAVPLCLSLGHSLDSRLDKALEALLLAYELGARMGECYRVPSGEHVDGTWGTDVASLAAAVMLEIGSSGERRAVSAALCQMSRSLFAPVQEGASCQLTGTAQHLGDQRWLREAAAWSPPLALRRRSGAALAAAIRVRS